MPADLDLSCSHILPCGRFQKLTERQAKTMKSKKTTPTKFSWINDRPVDVLAI